MKAPFTDTRGPEASRQFCGETESTVAWDVTFILKKVMLVSRSTVDFRSCSLSGLLAGKLFCRTNASEQNQCKRRRKQPQCSSVVQVMASTWYELDVYMDITHNIYIRTYTKYTHSSNVVTTCHQIHNTLVFEIKFGAHTFLSFLV